MVKGRTISSFVLATLCTGMKTMHVRIKHEELQSSMELRMDYHSVKQITKTIKIALPCRYITNEEAGVRDILESWKQQYVKELQGVVVSYKNVELPSNSGMIIADKPFVFYDVTATFELFCPSVGSIVKGKINRISQDFVGCLVHDTINVAIKLQENGLDELKNFLILDRMVLLKISSFSFHRRVIKVRGEITEECVRLMQADPLFRVENSAQKNTRITYSSDESDNSEKADSASDAADDDADNCDEQSQSLLAPQNTVDRTGPGVFNCDHLADGHGFSSNDSDSVLQRLKTEQSSSEDGDEHQRKGTVGEKINSVLKVQSPKKSLKKNNPKKRKRVEEDSTMAAMSNDTEAVSLIKAEMNFCDEMQETLPKKKRKKVREGVESPKPKKSRKRKSQNKEKLNASKSDGDSIPIDIDALLSQIKAERNSVDESEELVPKKKRKKKAEINESRVKSSSSLKSKKNSPNKKNLKTRKSSHGVSTPLDTSALLSLIKAESSFLVENEELEKTVTSNEQVKVPSPEKSVGKKVSKTKVKKSAHKSSSSNNIDSIIKKESDCIAENKEKPKKKRKKKDKEDGDISNSKKSAKKKSKKKERKEKDKKKNKLKKNILKDAQKSKSKEVKSKSQTVKIESES